MVKIKIVEDKHRPNFTPDMFPTLADYLNALNYDFNKRRVPTDQWIHEPLVEYRSKALAASFGGINNFNYAEEQKTAEQIADQRKKAALTRLTIYNIFPTSLLPENERKFYEDCIKVEGSAPPLALYKNFDPNHTDSVEPVTEQYRTYIHKVEPLTSQGYFEACTLDEFDEALTSYSSTDQELAA